MGGALLKMCNGVSECEYLFLRSIFNLVLIVVFFVLQESNRYRDTALDLEARFEEVKHEAARQQAEIQAREQDTLGKLNRFASEFEQAQKRTSAVQSTV